MNTTVSSKPEERRRVSVVAVLPGTKTGMTLMTKRIVDEMRQVMDVRLFDISGGYQKSNWVWRIVKASRSFLSGLQILSWRAKPGECLYIPINSQAGLLYNVWQFMMGRLRGFQIVAHHHVWSYLSSYDWRMDWLIRTAGTRGIHVVACPEMLRDLRVMYPRQFGSAFVTPGIVGPKSAVSSDSGECFFPGSRRFRLGMLSNLTLAKGVGEAIDTLENCLRVGLDVELLLAGPIRDEASRNRIESARLRHGDRLKHLGPLYDDRKDEFYRSLDAFIFPTRYPNESWGIVLNEALMAGVPVATFRRGCTAYLVGDAGLVVEQNQSFSELATAQVKAWIDDQEAYARARAIAVKRGVELREEAERQLSLFLNAFATKEWPPLPPLDRTTCSVVSLPVGNTSGEVHRS